MVVLIPPTIPTLRPVLYQEGMQATPSPNATNCNITSNNNAMMHDPIATLILKLMVLIHLLSYAATSLRL
jgi:hypothetical protein